MTKTNSVTTLETTERAGLLATFGLRYNVDPAKVATVLKQTCFRTEKPASDEQMMALLVVANEYQLNPFTREIYAFEDKHRGIVPIVPIDGWVRIINRHPELEALEFEYGEDEDSGPWVECIIHRKDRTKPTRVREYLVECKRNTGPWDSHPRRMLRHKALIQAGRVAFGLAGIFDPDEGERIREIDVTPERARKPVTAAPRRRSGRTPEESAALSARLYPAGEADLADGDYDVVVKAGEPTPEELRELDAEIAARESGHAKS